MGNKNAPAIFQRLINNILRDVIGKECFVYVYDILVFGKTEEEHEEILGKVLEILKN